MESEKKANNNKYFNNSHSNYFIETSPDGNILTSGSWDQTIKLWNLKPLTKIQI